MRTRNVQSMYRVDIKKNRKCTEFWRTEDESAGSVLCTLLILTMKTRNVQSSVPFPLYISSLHFVKYIDMPKCTEWDVKRTNFGHNSLSSSSQLFVEVSYISYSPSKMSTSSLAQNMALNLYYISRKYEVFTGLVWRRYFSQLPSLPKCKPSVTARKIASSWAYIFGRFFILMCTEIPAVSAA